MKRIFPLYRKTFTAKSTIGVFIVLEIPQRIFTLEDFDRGLSDVMTEEEIKSIKVQNETAIPYGMYKLIIYNSPKHKREVLMLEKVKGFSYVQVHAGNKAEDTDACILPGFTEDVDFVGNSKKAEEAVFNVIAPMIKQGDECFINIQKW